MEAGGALLPSELLQQPVIAVVQAELDGPKSNAPGFSCTSSRGHAVACKTASYHR